MKKIKNFIKLALALLFLGNSVEAMDSDEFDVSTAEQNIQAPRKKFSTAEDLKLKNLVDQFGTENWDRIAASMKGKNPRQCHDRWVLYLDPSVNLDPWTKAEEDLLLDLHKKYGNKWTVLKKFFDRRTPDNIKNKFTTLQRRMTMMSIYMPKEPIKKKPIKKKKLEPIEIENEDISLDIPQNIPFPDDFNFFELNF